MVAGAAALEHRIETGSWEGAGNAAFNGAIDGAVDGFMWGGIFAGSSQIFAGATKFLRAREVSLPIKTAGCLGIVMRYQQQYIEGALQVALMYGGWMFQRAICCITIKVLELQGVFTIGLE
jgi:hypothetical protein